MSQDVDSLREVFWAARRLADATEQDLRRAEREAERKLKEEADRIAAAKAAADEAELEEQCVGKLTLVIDHDYRKFRIFHDKYECITLIAEEEDSREEWDHRREEYYTTKHRMHIRLDQEDAELILAAFKKEPE